MFDRMVKSMKKIRKNNSGMALVSVIVVIGFIAALVSIVLVTTVVNFKMRAVNERSKDTFYSAEQALDEINIGLQRIVSDSMSEAYLEIMSSYSEYAIMETMSEEEQKQINAKRSTLLKTRFYENLWEELQYGDDYTHYDVKVLDNMLKETTRWHGGDSGYGAIIMAVNDDLAEADKEQKYGQMITYQNDGVVLKNLKIYYKDPAGFVSVIKTDIRMAYPDFAFDRTSEVPDIIYYSLLADEQAVIESSSNVLDMKGNIYANELTVEGRDIKTSDGDDITVKYDIDLQDGSNYTSGKDTVLWAQNLIAESSDVNLLGNINLSNDLNLKGVDSTFTLEGDFTGFGNNPDSSYRSSSILLNGKNSTIDVSKALSFVVAGHAYAGTSNSKKYKNDNPDLVYSENERMELKSDKNSDILMSESIAPKYDQLMYLIPASAIGVEKDTNISKYNKNPLSLDEYNEIAKNKDKYIEVSEVVEINELGGETLENYMKGESGDGASGRVKRVFVRVSDANVGGGALVYYYMDFSGQEKLAKEYFNLYYSNNKNSADKYMDFYIDEILMPTSSSADVKIAGDYFTGSKNDADGFSNIPGTTMSNAVDLDNLCNDKWSTYLTKVKVNDSTYVSLSFEEDLKVPDHGNQKYFEATLAENSTPIVSADGTTVYSKIKLEDFVNKVTDANAVPKNSSYKFDKQGADKVYIVSIDESGTEKRVGIVNKGTSAIASSEVTDDTCLIISKGDVAIANTQFHGLVICDRTVTFEDSVKEIYADPASVRSVLLMGVKISAPGGTEEIDVTNILEDSKQGGSGSGDEGDPSKKTPGGMITYENWSKE